MFSINLYMFYEGDKWINIVKADYFGVCTLVRVLDYRTYYKIPLLKNIEVEPKMGLYYKVAKTAQTT